MSNPFPYPSRHYDAYKEIEDIKVITDRERADIVERVLDAADRHVAPTNQSLPSWLGPGLGSTR